MDLESVLRNLYSAFSDCKRPEHFTDYEHCEECAEHDEVMRSATLDTLDSVHLGGPGWAPFSFLTVEGFAHYMPRILELAVTGKGNEHGDLFLSDILFQLVPGEEYDRFKNYSTAQRQAVLGALLYAKENCQEGLALYASEDDMEEAISYWGRNTNGVRSGTSHNTYLAVREIPNPNYSVPSSCCADE